MKAISDINGILVIPETDFEEEIISSFRCKCEAFVKCGLSPANIIGIAIRHKSKENSDNKEGQQRQPSTMDYTAALRFELERFFDAQPDCYENDDNFFNALAAHLNAAIQKQHCV